jgi:hypothetical protein
MDNKETLATLVTQGGRKYAQNSTFYGVIFNQI